MTGFCRGASGAPLSELLGLLGEGVGKLDGAAEFVGCGPDGSATSHMSNAMRATSTMMTRQAANKSQRR